MCPVHHSCLLPSAEREEAAGFPSLKPSPQCFVVITRLVILLGLHRTIRTPSRGVLSRVFANFVGAGSFIVECKKRAKSNGRAARELCEACTRVVVEGHEHIRE